MLFRLIFYHVKTSHCYFLTMYNLNTVIHYYDIVQNLYNHAFNSLTSIYRHAGEANGLNVHIFMWKLDLKYFRDLITLGDSSCDILSHKSFLLIYEFITYFKRSSRNCN